MLQRSDKAITRPYPSRLTEEEVEEEEEEEEEEG